ncbi:hypothetical protein TorRG33x02_000680 [Trema orientale]|uniref:Uncharacterized protein n=1 Tax=Trema orientale TaxID=63057 RepID=A0A2P5G133_TREOI|nr:hypothetical protein TorRG33x02_000680 [Trema orientale]
MILSTKQSRSCRLVAERQLLSDPTLEPSSAVRCRQPPSASKLRANLTPDLQGHSSRFTCVHACMEEDGRQPRHVATRQNIGSLIATRHPSPFSLEIRVNANRGKGPVMMANTFNHSFHFRELHFRRLWKRQQRESDSGAPSSLIWVGVSCAERRYSRIRIGHRARFWCSGLNLKFELLFEENGGAFVRTNLVEIVAELQMEVGIDRAQSNWIWFRDFFKESSLLVLMNRSLPQVLIGAVQPCLDYFVADFNCLQLCRSRQCHGVFASLDRLSNMPFDVLVSLLTICMCTGALNLIASF